ncbi:ribose-5-phosphate isomerase RpiA [Caulobacter sp. S45]|uniref:ribose-5-phosphate isomerase RpiA n=1 Tax=Caulobacter sp. S45 TaxID=1641861 RepID=UPI00131C2106|nr:ribose-5-phosphate isomerase RpiA [Caulobacter sp. S45]
MSPDHYKRAVGEAAALLVQDGMTVGLGTGSTAAFLVEALGARVRAEGLKLRCVPTSVATDVQARACGLPIVDLNEAGEIDLTIDGADEIGPGLALIKGGGGALLREKLVWEASRRCVAIADAGKVVETLGRFALPVEVVAFGHVSTARRMGHALAAAGVSVEPRLRMRDGATFITNGGDVIYDLACETIADPHALAGVLKTLTGVVEHGLFLGLADEALVGDEGGVRTLKP